MFKIFISKSRSYSPLLRRPHTNMSVRKHMYVGCKYGKYFYCQFTEWNESKTIHGQA